MAEIQVYGVPVREANDGYFWTDQGGDSWRWGVEGLFLWGTPPGTKRCGWQKQPATCNCLRDAVAWTNGWAFALRGLVVGHMAVVAPSLANISRKVGQEASDKIASEHPGRGPMPDVADWENAVKNLHRYAGTLAALAESLQAGLVTISLACGNAEAEAARLEGLFANDDPPAGDDGPKAA